MARMPPIEAAAILYDLEQSLDSSVPHDLERDSPVATQLAQALQVADGALLAQAVLDTDGHRPYDLWGVDQPATPPLRRAWAHMTECHTDLGVTVACAFPPSVLSTLFRIALEANGHPVDG